MKNKYLIIFIIILLFAIGIAIYFFTNDNSNKNSYTANKTSYNQNNINSNETNIYDNSTNSNQKKEEEISAFSTKIYSNDDSRQNNVGLTCGKLSGTIVANGSTFSFCDTLGPATENDGYEKAEIFDKDGNKVLGLGGGKCQVSTTLYNAVLLVPSLVVTERHPHSNKVPYIEDGKDAAVNYGTYDLKFRNDSGYDIKIFADSSEEYITIRLYKLI